MAGDTVDHESLRAADRTGPAPGGRGPVLGQPLPGHLTEDEERHGEMKCGDAVEGMNGDTHGLIPSKMCFPATHATAASATMLDGEIPDP